MSHNQRRGYPEMAIRHRWRNYACSRLQNVEKRWKIASGSRCIQNRK